MRKIYSMIIKRAPAVDNSQDLLFIFIVIILGIGSWAAWHFAFKKNNAEPTTSGNIVPISDSADIASKKNDSASDAQRITDSIENCPKKSC